MKVLVTGGRNYRNEARLFRELSRWHRTAGPITLIIHGNANGADTIAKKWAISNNIEQKEYPAKWNDLTHPDTNIKVRANGTKYDANAGKRRNQKMLDEEQPDLVIAFPTDGPGTYHMMGIAEKAGIRVVVGNGGG